MNPAETAVAEDADDFPALRVFRDVRHDGFDIGLIRSVLSRSLQILH